MENTIENTIEKDAYNSTLSTEPSSSYDLNYGKVSITRGIQAAALMALYLFALNYMGGSDIVVMKFMKYLFLGVVLFLTLKRFQEILPNGDLFKNGILLGAYTCMVSGLVLAIINTFTVGINADLAFQKFGLESEGLANTLVVSGSLFFEVFVMGMILTFIILQGLKRRSRTR